MSTKITPNVRSQEGAPSTGNAFVQRVLGHGQRLPVELPNSVDELKNWLIDQENHLARESARQGFGFLVLKQELGEGEFARWLVQHDFKEQRVYEHISVAKMLLAAPVNVQPVLMGLGKVKLIELARLPNETIDEVAERGELDELSRLSVRELKEEVRRLKSQNQSMAVDLEEGQRLGENHKAQGMKELSQDDSAHIAPDFIRRSALAEDWIDRGVKELNALQADVLIHFPNVQSVNSSHTWEMLACHLYTVTTSSYAKLRTLLDQLSHSLPESVQGGLVLIESRLTDKQLLDIAEARQYQARQAEQEQVLHGDCTRINGPKRRGRPRKLTLPKIEK
ncbi:hypothetical protein [Pseudomonas sp. NFIX28]|uniref:hypothetical protein n=1 Tax=Pseudomonas sp. NFIX28 TaxID=1566235 RepID=UPI0008975E3E|nr:hypothetical protein [Pseudomonas sp. NFIX28]SDZ68772.1 hypothetical protein SAMN03159453_06106 [Pseudomonas sp. NFIX28]